MKQNYHAASKNARPILQLPRLRSYAVLAVLASTAYISAAAQERASLVPQLGQRNVAAVAFSQDGHYLVTGGFDNTARLWDMETGKELRQFNGHRAGVTGVAFSPNGRLVLTGSADKTARLWDAASGKELRRFEKDEVLSVAFSPDGRYLMTGGFQGMQLLEVDTGNEQRRIKDEGGVWSVAFSPDGRFVLTGSSFGAHLWDRNTWEEVRCFGPHLEWGEVHVAFSPDGHYMLTGGDDKTARLWETDSCKELERFEAGDQIRSVAFSPDGRYVLIGSWDSAWLLDTTTAKVLRRFQGSDGVSAAFSPEGRYVVTATDNGVHIWDRKTWKEQRPIGGDAVGVDSVAFSSDGRYLMTGAQITALWRTDSGREIWRVETGGMASGGFSSDARSVLTTSGNAAVLLNTDTGKELGEFVGEGGFVISLALSPDGEDVVTSNAKGTVELWRKDTQKQLRRFEPEPLKSQSLGKIEKEVHGDISILMRSRSVAFSPDGRYVLTGGGAARLWETATGKELWRFEGSTNWRDGRQMSDWRQDIAMRVGRGSNIYVDSVAFSHDGRYVLTGIGSTTTLWDIETHSELRHFQGQAVKTLAFSPDDRNVLTAGWDHTARLWDTATAKELRRFEGHSDGVNSVAFFPNGRFVLTGSDDGTTKLWETNTGRELATLVSFRNGGWAAVDPDGRFDTSDLDGVAPLVWVAETEPMRALPLEIFMRDYYTPKLLARILNDKRLPAVRPIGEIKNRVQPKVEVTDYALEPDGHRATVRIRVTSIHEDVQRGDRRLVQDSGAFDLRLFRDGRLVKQYPEIPYGTEKVSGAVTTEADLEAWRKQHLILDKGETIISIPHVPLPQRKAVNQVVFTAYAFNRERIKSQTSAPFPAKIVSSLRPRQPRAYLITIGVNANQSGWDLTLAMPSAREAAALWTQKLRKDYEVVSVMLKSEIDHAGVIVPNASATKEGVQAVLDILAGRKDNVNAKLRKLVDPAGKLRAATPDDAVVLYIASHGYADPEERFYVVPYNTGPRPGISEELLTRCRLQADQSSACAAAGEFLDRAISSDEMASWWQGVDAGEMVMVLDSCHSGAVPGKDFRPGPLGNQGFGQLSYDKRIRILAATQPDKTARATNVERLGHTLLIEALETTAENGGNQSIGEWLRATERQLRPRAKNLYPEIEEGDLQLPELMDFVYASQAEPTNGSAQIARTEPAEEDDSISTDGETNQKTKTASAEMVDPVWTDGDTKLSWTQTDNGKSVNWEEASQYCGDLRLGGFSDWRLPTIAELQTILSATRRGSQLDDDDVVPGVKPPLNLDNVILWSDSKKEKDGAWTLGTSSYRRGYSQVQYSGSGTNLRSSISMRALCTRGTAKSLIPPGLTKLALECDVECAASVDGSAPQHVEAYHTTEFPMIYGDHEIEVSSVDGQNHISRKYRHERASHSERASDAPVLLHLMPTWTDPETKLTWQTGDYGRQLSWSEADEHCRQLRTDGYTDWRLPTIGELQTLLVRVPWREKNGKVEYVTLTGQVKADLQLNSCSDNCREIHEWSDSAYGPGMALVFDFNWVSTYAYGRAVPAGSAFCVRDGKPSTQTRQNATRNEWLPPRYPLLVECDLSCRVTVDGNPPRSLLAHRPTRFSVPKGIHWIEAKSADGRYRTTLTRGTEGQDSVFLALLPAWTDPDTGLTWTTNDDEKHINWEQANRYCRDLQLADQADWRLPTLTELETLAYPPQKGTRDDSKTGKHFELNWDEMWSSTSAGEGKAWSVGLVKSLIQQRDANVVEVNSERISALCVRGSGNNMSATEPALNIRCDLDCNVSLDGGSAKHLKANQPGRFPTQLGRHQIVATSTEDGSRVSFLHRLAAAEDSVNIALLPTWTDSRTSLMWTKKDSDETFGVGAEIIQAYCSELRIGGFGDWRLPTIQELRTIYLEHAFKQSLQLSACCELSNTKLSSGACYFDFDRGKPDCSGISPTDLEPDGNVATHVLCVRPATR